MRRSSSGVQQLAAYGCEALERRLLMAAGDLDPSFSGDGRMLTGFPGYTSAEGADVAVQADGKIIVVGTASNDDQNPNTFDDADVAVARYNADGTLDTTFDGDGRAVISPTGIEFNDDQAQEYGTAVAIRSDGKIVVGGYLPRAVFVSVGRGFVVQLNPDGSLDTTFGKGGVAGDVNFDPADSLADLAIDTQGRVVFVGQTMNAMMVTRLTPGGVRDASFNGSGRVTIGFPNADISTATAVALQPDGKIVVGGPAVSFGKSDFAIARLNPNGALDDGFGFAGRVLTSVGQRLSGSRRFDRPESLAIAPDGRIWVVGGENGTFLVSTRYLVDGSLDTTFGRNGSGVDTLRGMGNARNVVVQPDGKAIVTGPIYPHAAVFRLRSEDGKEDTSFAGQGLDLIDFPSATSVEGSAAIVLSDGRILVAGTAFLNGISAFAIFRLQGDSPLSQATKVWAFSSAWTAGFRQRLAAEGKGSADYGYELGSDPSGPPLPWTNIDTIAVRLSVPLAAAAVSGGLSVTFDGNALAVQSVATSPFDDKVILIRLSALIVAGRVRVHITNAQDSLSKQFDLTIPLLPGDVNQSAGAVNATDLVLVRNGVGRTAANPGAGPSAYRTTIDLNGDGVVNASDLVILRNRIGSSLSANLVINGGFERPAINDIYRVVGPGDTSLVGWTIDGAGIGHIGSYWQASEGTQSIELNQFAAGGASQSIPTQPGKQYRISFDMAGQPNAGPELKNMQVFWEGLQVKTELFSTHSSTLSNMGWSHREITVTATGNSAALRFFGSVPANADGGPALDNVSVTPVTVAAVQPTRFLATPVPFGRIEPKRRLDRDNLIQTVN